MKAVRVLRWVNLSIASAELEVIHLIGIAGISPGRPTPAALASGVKLGAVIWVDVPTPHALRFPIFIKHGADSSA